MNVGIYKASQGYWVRVMTAVLAGTLFLAGSAWAWSQAAALSLPIAGYSLDLAAVKGTAPAAATTVDLIGITKDARELPIDIGDAVVESYASLGQTAAELRIGGVVITEPGYDEGDISRVSLATVGGGEPSFAAQVRSRRPHTVFPLIYVQAGVAAVLILIGAVAVYWFVGLNRKSVDFLIATDGEMKKVNWSTRKEIIGNTQVTIVAAFLIAAILFGIDNVFRFLFSMIGVLEV